ncbi:MAG: ABC transporter permease [Sphingobacteriales bacterium]|nr:ABC transporter permease [Sphingobacteriales bacterium]
MISHYVKVAFRNIRKQKMYAAINVGGFAIGIAACLLIALFIQHETSYDSSNPNRNHIFRLVGEAKQNGEVHSGIAFPAPMAKAILNDFPEVEKAGRIMSNPLFGGANNQVRRPDEQSNNYEQGFAFADTSTLDILNVKMIYGNTKDALREPFSVILNKSMADKYFLNKNPVGQRLIFNDNPKLPIVVGGVMEDFPSNSHLQYRGFISLAGVSFWDNEQSQWTASNYDIYVQLKPGANVAAFEKKMMDVVVDKYMVPAMTADGQKNAKESFKDARIYLQPLSDIHLYSYNIEQDDTKHGDIRFVYLFAAIAAFILLLACINFLNLSTARSANRAKEVGVRKVIGGSRNNLINQFLSESLLYSFLSFFIGAIIAVLALPMFSKVAGIHLSMPWKEWWLLPALIGGALIIGLLAGLYPAFYLSYFKPINTLKGNVSLGSRNGRLRSALVVFQFTISVVLLTGTAVIYKQMQYILNSKTGFDKDQVLMIEGTDALRDQTTSFKNELLNLPVVKNVSVSDFLPVNDTKRNGNTFWEEGKQINDGFVLQHWVVDENYIPTLGMKLIAGRNFSKDFHTDSSTTVVNKALADQLGIKDPVGKTITNGGEHLRIIGVVDNFYFETMKQQVKPLCMVLGNSNSIVSVKIKTADMKAALTSIEAKWKQFLPNHPMRVTFLDERYAAMYIDVQRMQYIFTGFSILAVVVACLGLFALAAFMAEQRTKEIGIRKVLGASVAGVFALLTKNFLKLVFLSLIISIPIGWWLMNKWLQDFSYRISPGWEIFAFAAILMLAIALFTICFQALKAAVANPIKSLRIE